ncbi:MULTISPECIES: lysozyme inhibitor LprI family protein [Azorhizobium]|uniref:lysozyme inhibitor LprI family protein n=1 Tax=Azorhizobium TaxID=6 RepID=UPI001062015A|nr:hypothetical protein [Azorhizobium sp. AG788]TDU01036.1 hypothetical protein DFO45_0549 [Azorhizobium sp. AG788]
MTLRRASTALALLGLVLAFSSAPAAAASFDCTKARSPDEKAVCVNRDLSDLDVRAATLYDVLTHLVAMGERGIIQDQQRAFLAYRATCGSRVPCIRKVYEQHVAQLTAGLQAIYARGPF